MTLHAGPADQIFLGIEGGGTRTVALLANARGEMLARIEAGPANVKLMTDARLTAHFRGLAPAFGCPDAVAIGLAGARVEEDRERIRSAAARVWPRSPCYATNDLETALTAAAPNQETPAHRRVLIVSGTGSCCYGKTARGLDLKVGGWGHILGDKGSGYEIGLRGVKVALHHYDCTGEWPGLGRRILRALQLNMPDDLIGWAQQATKPEVASLALEVFAAWGHKDNHATDIINAAVSTLARDAAGCARRLAGPANRVEFILAGAVLQKQPRFAALLGRQLRRLSPGAIVHPLGRESVWGAVELAKQHFARSNRRARTAKLHRAPVERGDWNAVQQDPARPGAPVVMSSRLPPTEQRHHCSMNLHKMDVAQAVRLMLSEDATVPKKLLAHTVGITRAVRAVARAFRRGGRLFYVGAGTSGRLGVLDASECPPTFRTPPELVQGILAGGETALRNSVEGAEDDMAAGASAIRFRGLTPRDVVVGIAASGTTPFVWGAVGEAKTRGATTILLCFNPYLVIPRALRPAIVIAPNLGPELLTGSTRLKAGTATKLVLNILTTLAMVQLGKVRSNLMIDLHPANTKLRQRAVRILGELTRVDAATAQAALERSGWVIKTAIARLAGRSEPRASERALAGTRRSTIP